MHLLRQSNFLQNTTTVSATHFIPNNNHYIIMYRCYRQPLLRLVPVHQVPQMFSLVPKRRFVTSNSSTSNITTNICCCRTTSCRIQYRYASNNTTQPPPPPPSSSSPSSTTATTSKTIPQQQPQQNKSEPTIIGHFISRSNKEKFINRILVVEETSDGKKRIAMKQKKMIQPQQQHQLQQPQTTNTVSFSSPGTGSSTASSTTSSNTSSTSSSSSSSTAIATYQNSMQIIRVGLPLILFSILSAWVVSNAYGGKLKELEVSQGKTSISIRQATLQAEHDEMMERLNKIISSDYDNTKRIKRPEEILEERRLERQKRNVWYRRWYRAITGSQDTTSGATTSKKD